MDYIIMHIEKKTIHMSTKKTIEKIKSGSLATKVDRFDKEETSLFHPSMLGKLKLNANLKPRTSPFNFNLPDIMRSYLECRSTKKNITKVLLDIIQSDMDRDLAEFPSDDEMMSMSDSQRAKVIELFVYQSERHDTMITHVVDRIENPYKKFHQNIDYHLNNLAGRGPLDKILCHTSLEPFVKNIVKGTSWEQAISTYMPESMRAHIFILKDFEPTIFNLRDPDVGTSFDLNIMNDYFYDTSLMNEWIKNTMDKYRIKEIIRIDGSRVFRPERYIQSAQRWQITGAELTSLEAAKEVVEFEKKKSVVKEVIHEV